MEGQIGDRLVAFSAALLGAERTAAAVPASGGVERQQSSQSSSSGFTFRHSPLLSHAERPLMNGDSPGG